MIITGLLRPQDKYTAKNMAVFFHLHDKQNKYIERYSKKISPNPIVTSLKSDPLFFPGIGPTEFLDVGSVQSLIK